MGVKWMRKVRSYSVAMMMKTVKEALRTAERGLKVIIADGECQLARQRRVRVEDAGKLERGERVMRTTLRRRRRNLHRRPFLHPAVGLPVADGEALDRPAAQRSGGHRDRNVASAAVCAARSRMPRCLCPSFYRAEIVRNATWWDRVAVRIRQTVIGWFGGYGGEAAA